ncbi:3-hydroxyacyl-CoA dehydrogenase NAD-binding domain-containing protein [Pedobacter sp. ASV1-7]|uniref:3-hydroxyacyl-CoA dehydrogenase family protein n=1 Tax=Pedobacter sp. ASV1-7 TaxID=3145237 RepID=UPI0032E8B2E7
MCKLTEISIITILGSGKMGRSIASFFSEKGIYTILYDPFEEALGLAKSELTEHSKVTFTTDLKEAVSNADLIIESAPENLEIKKNLYQEITPYLKSNVIVASNTSTYPLLVLSKGQSFKNRMLIVHFFNPADLVPLVEIVKQDDTEEGIVENVKDFLSHCGKVPVVLQKDIKGFIANRLQSALLREACYLLKEGVADAASIDTVVKESIGLRWALNGPFEITDYGGLDIWAKVLNNLLPFLDNSITVPDIIAEKVAHNKIGVKTGEGFFNYECNISNQEILKQRKLLKSVLDIKKS